MNSRLTLLILLLLMLGMVGQVQAATITAVPDSVPKGAYADGPLNGDNNYFWQMVTLDSDEAHAAGQTAVITLPLGMTVADTDGDADYSEEISVVYDITNGGMTITPTSADGTAITLTIGAQPLTAADDIQVMFPVAVDMAPAADTDDYYVTYTAGTDDIANGSGEFVQFVDPGPNTLGMITFAANMIGYDDTTNTKGDRYPTTAAATLSVALPDLAIDGGSAAVNSGNIIGQGGSDTIFMPTLDATENGTETLYTVYISTDSTLAHVDSLTAGVFKAYSYPALTGYTDNETGTLSTRYSLSGLPEGTYFFYVTSMLTGDFSLGRSGALVVRHWPVLNSIGWDYDHDTLYEPGVANDDQDLTMDSGSYFDYTGTATGTNAFTYADLFVSVDDLDDNATVYLYYASQADLDTSDVVWSGSANDSTLAVSSLTGGILIAADLLENAEDEQGFINQRWWVHPDSVGIITATDYYVYAITVDGRHYDMSVIRGTDAATGGHLGATALASSVRHSPAITIDALNEYDSDTGTIGYQIDVSAIDQIMLSWGKTGIIGDRDADDSAVIEFYIVADGGGDNLSDYDHDEADLDPGGLRADTADPANVLTHHQIVTTLNEDFEGKNQSWYTWDIQNDSWSPVDGTQYFLYAIIDENKTGGTAIIYTIGQTFLETTDNLQAVGLTFDNLPYGKLQSPPAEGVVVNAEETYRVPFSAFDWDQDAEVAIYLVSTAAVGGTTDFSTAPLTTVVGGGNGILDVGAGEAYLLTDDDGNPAANTAYLSEDTNNGYYDIQLRVPGSAAVFYTDDVGANGTDLADGDYWVYIAIGDNTIANTDIAYRSPGILTVVNAGLAAVQRNMTISPMEIAVAEGETVNFAIKGADNGGTVDRIDAYIAVEKDWWTLANPTTPFTPSTEYAGQLLTNSVVDDAANNRWILRTVVFNGGTALDLDDAGVGENVATFSLVSKGTTDALQHETSVYFVNEPSLGYVSKFSNDGVDISINSLASTVKVVPRALVRGIVELEGRTQMNSDFTFELRERGGYDLVSDTLFVAANDIDSGTTGVQYTPDTDGIFLLTKVPSGEYDLVVKYDRYLSKLIQIDSYAGVDTLTISFGQLLGGDCFGYRDSLGGSYPDNQVDTGDVNRITSAFGAGSSNPNWNDGVNNWKYADIDEDQLVWLNDLSITTKNATASASGAQPVYKPAVEVGGSNMGTTIEFVDVPAELVAGQKYTIQIVARNTESVRAYYLNLDYDQSALDFTGISAGDFFEASSHSFPYLRDEKVGLVNSVYGDNVGSGDGVLAEILFTAVKDGAFSSDMLTLDALSIVTAGFMTEDIVNSVTDIQVSDVPTVFALGQNFPNPFNPTTTINFSVPADGFVNVKVYDVLGRYVASLVEDHYSAGTHHVVWDARDISGNMVSNGVYFYTIESGNFHATKRMMFIK